MPPKKKKVSPKKTEDIIVSFIREVPIKNICNNTGLGNSVVRRVLSEAGLLNIKPRTDKYITKSPDEKLTPCKCPSCREGHLLKLVWTGKLPARKMCRSCQVRSSNLSNSYYNGNGGGKRASSGII